MGDRRFVQPMHGGEIIGNRWTVLDHRALVGGPAGIAPNVGEARQAHHSARKLRSIASRMPVYLSTVNGLPSGQSGMWASDIDSRSRPNDTERYPYAEQ